jgi:cell division septation protein DedD
VPEPRTHYQISFTSRQAVLLFVIVLVSLAGAYFLGLLTGLAGRQPSQSVAVAPPATAVTDKAPDRTVSAPTKPPGAEAPTAGPALAAREPATADGLQFFEDHPEEAPKTTPATPAKRAAAPAPAAAGGYWVQVLATSSEKEARSYRTRISARGYRAAVESARGPKGLQYRVRVGPYPSREDAARAQETLVRKVKARTWIVSPGQ